MERAEDRDPSSELRASRQARARSRSSPIITHHLFNITARRLSLLARHLTTATTKMSSAYAKEQAVAISAVLKASLLARKVQDQLVGSGGVQKKDKSPVTGEF